MKKKSAAGLGALQALAVLVLGLLVFSCNTDPEVDGKINLYLADSLTVEAAKYATIRVDIVSTDGAMLVEKAFEGRFSRDDQGVIRGIAIGKNPPSSYKILVSGLDSAGKVILTLEIGVSGGQASVPVVKLLIVPADTSKGDTTKPNLPTPVKLTLKPNPIKVALGSGNQKVEVTVEPQGSAPKLVWESANPAVLTSDTAGNILPLKVGTTMLRVHAKDHPAVKDSAAVEVFQPALNATAISVSPTRLTLYTGDPAANLAVAILPADGNQIASFISSDAEVASVSLSGAVTGKKAGTAMILAFPAGQPTLTAKCTVTVTERIRPTRVDIQAGTQIILELGAVSQPLLVSVFPPEANQAVVLASQDEKIVAIDTGKVLKALKEGQTKVVVWSKDDPALADTLTVSVIVPRKVDKLVLSPRKLDLVVGGTKGTVTSEITPVENAQGALYTIGNTAVARVSADGQVEAVAAGTTTLVARAAGYPSVADSIPVTVVESGIKIQLLPKDTTVTMGDSVYLTLGITNPNLQKLDYVVDDQISPARTGTSQSASALIREGYLCGPPGTIRVSAKVKLGGLEFPDTAYIQIVRDAPTATLGRDTTVIIGTTSSYQADWGDKMGTVASVHLKVGSGSFQPITSKTISFAAPSAPGLFLCSLRVADDDNNVVYATKRILVSKSPNTRLQALKLDGATINLGTGQTVVNLPDVPYSKAGLPIEATAEEAEARIRVATAESTHTGRFTAPLAKGANEVVIAVTAPDGATSNAYIVNVKRLGSNLLSGLEPAVGSLKPAFEPSRMAYTMAYPVTSEEAMQWKVTAQDTDAVITPNYFGISRSRVLSGGYTPDYAPILGKQTVSLILSQAHVAEQTYTLDICKQGWRSVGSRYFQFDAFQDRFDMVTDGTDIYVAMVDEYAGSRVSMWKISDTTITTHGPTGFSPKTWTVAVTSHGGSLITGYQTVPPTDSEIGKNAFMIQDGTGAWSAHSELPCNNSFSGWGMDVYSFDNRLFATCEERQLSDSGSYWEYKNGAWALYGQKVAIWQAHSRFFTVGNTLYHIFYGNNQTQVRKLGASGFTTVGPALTGTPSMSDALGLSEDGSGRPVMALSVGSFPNMAARVYRLEGGSWNLMKEYTTAGSVEAVSLLRVPEGLLLMYTHDSNARNYILNESNNQWEKYRDVGGIGPSGNLTQFKMIRTNSAMYLVTVGREALGLNKFEACTGY